MSKCVQLSIVCEDSEALTQLRDRINRVLLKRAGAGAGTSAASAASGKQQQGGCGAPRPGRRPLAPRSLNTLSEVQAPSTTVVSLRSGPAPSASGFSLGPSSSRQALASSAESGAAEEEELGALSEEQQRALQLVRGGRSIFFTGGASRLAGWGGGGRRRLAGRGGAGGGGWRCSWPVQCRHVQRALAPGGLPAVLCPLCSACLLRPPPRWRAGCAGTGKSLLLRHILRSLPRGTTFVTGTTGLAACHLGGTTINTYAGIGRAEGSLGGWAPACCPHACLLGKPALCPALASLACLPSLPVRPCLPARLPHPPPTWHPRRPAGAPGQPRRVAAAVASHHPPHHRRGKCRPASASCCSLCWPALPCTRFDGPQLRWGASIPLPDVHVPNVCPATGIRAGVDDGWAAV